jgi:hypothetical protein
VVATSGTVQPRQRLPSLPRDRLESARFEGKHPILDTDLVVDGYFWHFIGPGKVAPPIISPLLAEHSYRRNPHFHSH